MLPFAREHIFCLHAGGLKAVIYTDTLQTVIMVGGAIVLMALSKKTSLLNP